MRKATFTCKQFSISQDQCAMKVSTDACVFGAWAAQKIIEIELPSPKILDIGTGTGLLSLMVAQQVANCSITAIEIDAAAAKQANENIQHSPWHKNIQVLHTDIKQYSSPNRFDIIISNPPFYERDLLAATKEKNAAFHDSSLTLSELLKASCNLLNTNGCIFLIVPVSRKIDLIKYCDSLHLLITDCCYIKPAPNKKTSRIVVKCQRDNSPGVSSNNETELIVQGDYAGYSLNAFLLLKEYYLHL